MARVRVSTIASVFLVVAITAWFWIRGEHFIAANGPTFDEGVHLVAGYSYWETGDFRLNREDPPLLKLLWALPLVLGDAPAYPRELAKTTTDHWKIADEWLHRSSGDPRIPYGPSRRVNLVIGSCVVVLIGWWSFRVWGSKLAGLAACAFASADPSLLALSCILSTDVGLTFFALLTCYLMWEYVEKPSRGLLIATGISLGFMLATKFSAVAIAIGLGVTGLLHLGLGGRLTLPGKTNEHGLRPAIELAIRLSAIAFVSVAAIYCFIQFDQWPKGLKFQLTRAGNGDGVMYLNGEISHQGWFHYFIVALLVKLPLGLLIAAATSALIILARFTVICSSKRWCGNKGNASPGSRVQQPGMKIRDLWLIIPPVVFFALASYSRVDLGIRVVLPIVPYLYLLASGLASCQCCRPLCLSLLAGCLAWCGVVAVRTNPHEIGYFNECAGWLCAGKPILADSNLDWGQGLPALKEWMDREQVDQVYLAFFGTDRPEAYGIHYRQLPGYGSIGHSNAELRPENTKRVIVTVSTNLLWGLYLNDPDIYSWLRAHTPISRLDGSIQIFEVTDDSMAIERVRSLIAQ